MAPALGRWLTPGLGTDTRAQGIEAGLPGAVPGPPLEGVVDRLPGRKVMRQGTPTAALAGLVEQGVQHRAPVRLAAPTAWPSRRNQRHQDGPRLVSEVTRIGFTFHTLFDAPVNLWNRLLLRGASSCQSPAFRPGAADIRSGGAQRARLR